jgi:hypothetical protein
MTLIASFVSAEHAVQVSDRRLTSGSLGRLIDDHANKAVLFCGRMAFGYTGLASIGSSRTDRWLTDVLSDAGDVDVAAAVRALRIRATAAFAQLPYESSVKRHAFVGVGWARLRAGDPLSGLIYSISNFTTPDWRPLDRAAPEFDLLSAPLAPGQPGFLLWFTGHPGPTGTRLSRLRRDLRGCLDREVGPAEIARLLVTAMRDVARRDTAVGESLLVISLPRAVCEDDSGLPWRAVSAPPGRHGRAFWYMPANTDELIEYGPNAACAGAAITDFTVTRPPRRPSA